MGKITLIAQQWRLFQIFKKQYFVNGYLFLKNNFTKRTLIKNDTTLIFLVFLYTYTVVTELESESIYNGRINQ